MRILFLTIKPANRLVDHKTEILFYNELVKSFPGSVIYGPGYAYESVDVLEIMEAYGGQNSFDAVWCGLPERVLLGEPFGENIIEHYGTPPKLWRFPVNLKAVRCAKIIFFGDFWHLCRHEWAQIFLQHGFDVAISGFISPFIGKDVFTNFFPLEVRERVPFLPMVGHFSSDICRDLHEERPYDVFMGGAQVPEFYPVRWQMLQAFSQSPLSLYAPQHPGYNYHPQSMPRDNVFPYVRMLNRSKISAFCSTRFHFSPSKLFEAMACGAIALCNFFHGMEHLGFRPNEHFLLADGANCVDKATALLRDPEKLQEMRDKAHTVVHERHTIELRAQEMAEMLPAVLNGEKPVHWAALSPNLRLVRARQRMAAKLRPELPRIRQSSIFDYRLTVRESTWTLWHRLGTMHYLPQEETQDRRLPALVPARRLLMGHLDLLKAELLVFLARKHKCRSIVEMGTRAGFFSMALARWLHDEKLQGGITAVGDEPHHEPALFMSAFTLERAFSRHSLLDNLPGLEQVCFLHTAEWTSHRDRLKKIDFLLLNSAGTVLQDYSSARDLLGPESIVAVDNYGDQNPLVLYSVERLAAENKLDVEHVTTGPNAPGMALCRAGDL